MIGLPERTIVMSCEDAKEYVASKLLVLTKQKEELEERLIELNIEIEHELDILESLNNPPVIEQSAQPVIRLTQF